jgi:hypothetical protein
MSDWGRNLNPGAATQKGGRVASKNTFVGKESGCFGKSQQKLSLPYHSFRSSLTHVSLFSLRSISIPLALVTVALGPVSGLGLDGNGGEGRLLVNDVLPLLCRIFVPWPHA